MILMILLFLTGSEPIIASDDIILVHEWGVVLTDEVVLEALGAERGFLEEDGTLQPYSMMLVDAPVIWFHGPPFSGSLTVTVQNGYFTLLIPNPAAVSFCDEPSPVFSEGENYVAVWEDLVFTDDESMPADRRGVSDSEAGFEWAMPFWREVPALTVRYDPLSFTDRFVYYECSASNLFDSNEPLENIEGSFLMFYGKDGELTADLMIDRGITVESALSRDGILEIFAGWGNDEFLEEEIEALWQTWKPSLLSRCVIYGEKVIVFPLTGEQVESISTIELETELHHNVVYSRLFLAIGSM